MWYCHVVRRKEGYSLWTAWDYSKWWNCCRPAALNNSASPSLEMFIKRPSPKAKRNTYLQNNTNIGHPNMAEYLWSVSSYLAPNNLDHLCPEITLPQTPRMGTQTASRHLASTSGLGLDGIPVQRAEYFLFSFNRKLKYQKTNKSLFPITGWHNFYVIWNNKQGHLHGIWLLLGKDITGIQWVYFWFIGLSHFNKPVLTQTYLPVKW